MLAPPLPQIADPPFIRSRRVASSRQLTLAALPALLCAAHSDPDELRRAAAEARRGAEEGSPDFLERQRRVQQLLEAMRGEPSEAELMQARLLPPPQTQCLHAASCSRLHLHDRDCLAAPGASLHQAGRWLLAPLVFSHHRLPRCQLQPTAPSLLLRFPCCRRL